MSSAEALDFHLLFLSRLFAETDGPDRSEFEEGRSDVTLRAAARYGLFWSGPGLAPIESSEKVPVDPS
jgi:hypothetical protein